MCEVTRPEREGNADTSLAKSVDYFIFDGGLHANTECRSDDPQRRGDGRD
jgi:hypothetical protein